MASRYLVVILCLSCGSLVFGQEKPDTVAAPVDTTRSVLSGDSTPVKKGRKVISIDTYAKRFNPRRAMMLSATFPGWGQAYNNKYWKLPIVYGGFATGIYIIDHYQGLYNTYKSELFIMLNDPTMSKSPLGYTEDQLRSIINTSRRQRDFFCIVTGIWYMIQIVDAHVDAHLKEFDLNPQLQVRLEPTMENNLLTGRSKGLSLILKF